MIGLLAAADVQSYYRTMKRLDMSGAECPVARSLDAVGDWWSLLIVRDAFDGVRRFNDFQRSLGIARGILTTRLRELVERGVFDVVPPSNERPFPEYALTPLGRDLLPVIVALRQWGENHFYRAGEQHSRLIAKATGKPVDRLVVRSGGRPVAAGDVEVLRVSGRGTGGERQKRS
jgi:DNA-binding HxlR family transcriptional regulator